ncbi:DNA topoisomerase-3 [Paenibacillus sp. 1182]|uniref:type IA DNA topoisomerase n=1 Tax=Paenibacillus sp. 1182 TaxID=2806565 RepID=UPI001AE5CE30|nr:type IA DNA topoisomerase [Paenibacillus sp. 1182]MBP1308751.1 DNA topoisomerase-3 [Paenibacillus sp. 1182]
MRALLIAEKPDLMKQIRAVYDKFGHADQITFKTFAGHTMTLVEPHEYKQEWEKWNLSMLPMIPETFRYKPSKDKLKMYKELKDEILSEKYDYVINACDPGREGQHIFFSFYHHIGARLPVKRLWSTDLTENKLSHALNNLRDEKEPALINMTLASKYRAYFDWLIGLNATRAVTMIANKKINVGRVMTPVLKLIVDRELELRNFVPKDFWEIESNFGGKYKGLYYDHNNENESRFFDRSKAESMCSKFGEEGVVLAVDQNREVKYAPKLHSLQELSNEANRTYGYTMAETLKIAQVLYEKKLLSYPRTNSPFVTKSIAKEFNKNLQPLLSIAGLKDSTSEVLGNTAILEGIVNNKKYVDDSKVTDHYAIIPTGLSVDFSKLSTSEQNIYMLVSKRFLSIFLPPLVMNKSSIITESNGHRFKTTGSVLVDLGFMRLYEYKNNDNILPSVKKGEVFKINEIKLIQKETTPPQRYNDYLLGKTMENPGKLIEDEELSSVFKGEKGLGTPATRAGIIEKLVYLAMIERKGSGKVKSYFATDFGVEIIEGLHGKDITMPELTATWEQKLSQVEEGTYDPKVFYSEMIQYTKFMIEDFKHTKVSVSQQTDKEVIGKCPKCSSDVIEGKSFYLCTKYKDTCDFLIAKEIGGAKVSKTEAKKLLSGKETKELELKFKSGATRKAKLMLSPEFKVVPSGSSTGSSVQAGERKVIGTCPKCSKQVIVTKDYYKCEDYKNPCTFIQKRVFCGAEISEANMKAILNGKQSKELEFTWNSGKTGTAKLEWKDDKISFVFPSKNK